MKRSRRTMLTTLALVLGAVVFWWLRIRYWATTSEDLFSDMADFERIALGVVRGWDFRHSVFWQSYRPPGVPLMRAAVMVVFGRDESREAWRWVLGAFTFLGLGWMAVEIFRATGRRWLAVVLVWTVALSKASIFWSYKMASEGPAEALLYCSVAASLLAVRRPRLGTFFLAGAWYAAALLTRPNFLAMALLCPAVMMAIEGWRARRQPDGPLRYPTGAVVRLLALGLGLGLVWSPWLVRSYRLYGHVVPLTTHGPFAFFWEIGTFHVDLEDGESVTTSEVELRTEAQRRFESDYAASRYVQRLAIGWLAENWRGYLGLVRQRALRSATDTTESLTRVSRTELFPGALNRLLLDKSPFLLLGGVSGLVLLSVLFPPLTIVLVSCLGPWLFAVMISGYPRYVDPMLPLILAGNAGWLAVIEAALRRRA